MIISSWGLVLSASSRGTGFRESLARLADQRPLSDLSSTLFRSFQYCWPSSDSQQVAGPQLKFLTCKGGYARCSVKQDPKPLAPDRLEGPSWAGAEKLIAVKVNGLVGLFLSTGICDHYRRVFYTSMPRLLVKICSIIFLPRQSKHVDSRDGQA